MNYLYIIALLVVSGCVAIPEKNRNSSPEACSVPFSTASSHVDVFVIGHFVPSEKSMLVTLSHGNRITGEMKYRAGTLIIKHVVSLEDFKCANGEIISISTSPFGHRGLFAGRHAEDVGEPMSIMVYTRDVLHRLEDPDALWGIEKCAVDSSRLIAEKWHETNYQEVKTIVDGFKNFDERSKTEQKN